MNKNTVQDQRLDYLVEAFKADSDEYKNLQTPDDRQGKQRILRSLMNIRMPKKISEDVLLVQNEYLRNRADEKGIVQVSDIAAKCPVLTTMDSPSLKVYSLQ